MKPEDLNVRGQLNMLVLAVLESGPQQAHAVRQTILQRSGDYFDLSASAVNAVLYRLEHLRLVTTSWSVIDGRHQRAYQLTAAGKDRLDTHRAAWEQGAAVVTGILGSGQLPPDQ